MSEKSIIWKYTLIVQFGRQEIMMPKCAEVLCACEQGNQVCIWAVVSPDHKPIARGFWIHPTGGGTDVQIVGKFCGTVMISGLVLHVFEDIKLPLSGQNLTPQR